MVVRCTARALSCWFKVCESSRVLWQFLKLELAINQGSLIVVWDDINPPSRGFLFLGLPAPSIWMSGLYDNKVGK